MNRKAIYVRETFHISTFREKFTIHLRAQYRIALFFYACVQIVSSFVSFFISLNHFIFRYKI